MLLEELLGLPRHFAPVALLGERLELLETLLVGGGGSRKGLAVDGEDLSSSFAISPAVAKRSSGFFESARSMTRWTSWGRSEFLSTTGFGASLTML
jgi:hypothetical protein